MHNPWQLAHRLLAAWLVLHSIGAASPIGTQVDDFQLPDHRGHEHQWSDLCGEGLVVIAFLGTECPLAKRYAARLQTLADEYRERGVRVVGVCSNVHDSLADITHFVQQHRLRYPVLKDRGNRVADQLGAERTPQVFLVDRQGIIRYTGRVDDQYVVGIVRAAPSREDLREAIDQLLAGKEVSVPTTEAIGCILGRVRAPAADSPVVYTRDIAPILQRRCVECHRHGEIGPFALESYDDAAGWGAMLLEVVENGTMPPWHANPRHGRFANERSMPDEEKELLRSWVDNGCPEGDPRDLPPPRVFTKGWQLPRKPDRVLRMAEPFAVPADAGKQGVPYQYFEIPGEFAEDTWVEAAEIQPGNPRVVHHSIAYAVPPGGERQDWIFLAAYVPGLRLDPLPQKAAKCLPAGSKIVLEQHYTPIGSEQTDITSLGLMLADPKGVTQEIVTCEVGDFHFRIPPHAAAHVVTATSHPMRRAVTLVSFSPHMHLRGAAFRYELVTPEGEREILLDVPRYDFNWQTRYVLAQPRKLLPGAVIHCRAVFDNSANNLANPDPTQAVGWGDQSWEEMMLGFVDVVLPRDDSRKPGSKPLGTGRDVVGLFDRTDQDADGGLSRDEAAGHEMLSEHFDAIDRNNDSRLQLDEILRALAKAEADAQSQ